MSLPVAVINFDEFLSLLEKDIDIEIDTSSIEDILNYYFPQILDILNQIKELMEIKGIQKIKGFISNGEPIRFTPSENILITGITISQNIFNLWDKWDVYIIPPNEDCALKILDNIYSKDSLQHKYFIKHYPVPAGYKILIEPNSYNTNDTTFWFDLEYLELIE